MEFVTPWLALLGLVLPLVVAAVTRSSASATVKGWVLAALSGVAAVLAEVVSAGDFAGADWRVVLNNLLLIFAASVIAYKGGLVKAPAEAVAERTASTGVGGDPL